MTPENFIKSLKEHTPVNTADIKKKKYSFSLIHLDLAPTAGFPTVHFLCERPETEGQEYDDVYIRMSLTPIIGIEKATVNGLSYVIAVLSPDVIPGPLVALIASSLLETFQCAHIKPQNDVPDDNEHTRLVFRLSIERKPEYMDGVYVHSVIATVEVEDSAYNRAKELVQKQLTALERNK